MQNYTEKEVAYGALGPLQITSIILYISNIQIAKNKMLPDTVSMLL